MSPTHQAALELLAQSGEQGLIEVEEQRFAERGFAFADRHEQDVMQPGRAIDFVLSDIDVAELLRRMRDERRHMVLVTDAHDRTVGLLTLEDLLEELVGEIENDTDSPLPTRSRERIVVRRAPQPRRYVRSASAPSDAERAAQSPGHLQAQRPPDNAR